MAEQLNKCEITITTCNRVDIIAHYFSLWSSIFSPPPPIISQPNNNLNNNTGIIIIQPQQQQSADNVQSNEQLRLDTPFFKTELYFKVCSHDRRDSTINSSGQCVLYKLKGEPPSRMNIFHPV